MIAATGATATHSGASTAELAPAPLRPTGSRAERRRSAGRGRQYLFGVNAGRVRWVALASAGVARNARELARELKLAGVR